MLTPVTNTAVTADGAVATAPGMVVSVLLAAGDAAAASLVLYDNASAASGRVLATLKALQGTSAEWSPAAPFVFSSGVYADITGSGAAAYIVTA